ncbi:MAG: AAC(3) family N-acetyltransferase [Clostridia bacterium]|nr:AAC(3) family N-acetyltransferase [Clostridia bacterium]
MFTKQQIFEQLKEMRAPQNSVVLVHSSLRSVGETEGRGEGFLETLIEYFTSDGGLLCIPTHTWANVSDKNKITLDLLEPKTCIGTLPDIAACHSAAVRSTHPTHSMAVFGDKHKAQEFVSGEEKQITPAHPSGCYGKIFNNNGYILLVGVGHNRNTYLHCVEEMLGITNRLAPSPEIATMRHKDGRIETRMIHPHNAVGIGDVSLRYPKYEPAFRYHNCIVDGKIGNAVVQLCSARKMKEVMELIFNRSGGAELFADDTLLDETLYM